MRRFIRHSYLTALSVFALIVQMLSPSLAMAGGVSPSLICNPSGQISAKMQAGIDELKTALGIEDQDANEAMDCEDCIASLVFIPTSPSLAVTQTKWTDTTVRVRSQFALIAQPRGPPLGPRAPPPNL